MKGIIITEAATPEQVIAELRRIAEEFRHSQMELRSAWQDPAAGNIWGYLAKRLESVADGAEKHWSNT